MHADPAAAPPPVRLADYAPPRFLVDTIDLTIDLDPSRTTVRARSRLRRAAPGPLVLDGENLTLEGTIVIDGAAIGPERYALGAESLSIASVPDEFTLEITTIVDPAANTALSGLYLSRSGFFTQCEPEGFRRITFFPDRPDVMAIYTVTLIADRAAAPVLLSNGNPAGNGDAGGGRHWARWEDPHPKPSYLFALVAADLHALCDSFTTRSGRAVDLAIWVRDGEQPRAAHAMAALKAAMRWDEETFGLEYDLDVFNIAAVADFNMGAMENKGLNIFNTAYVLASPETATDTDFQNVARVVAHEYFHNWTGDRVTCRDWFQLSLKEGLTVFRDQEFTADTNSAAVKRIADVRLLRSVQFREDAGPLAHPIRPASYLKINNFYTTTIYEKGAEVVRMIRTLIGPAAFRRGMDLYIARHDNAAATVEDFVAAMADAAERDLSPLMLWYEQAGTPEIRAEERYDAANRRLTVTLRQATPPTPGQPEKQPFPMPVAAALIGADGGAVGGERVILFDKAEQEIVFENAPEGAVPSLFRRFSAPVKFQGRGRARLAFLARHETDRFNRWDALQDYAAGVLLAAVADGRFTPDDVLEAAFAAILDDAETDPAFAAEALVLPAESLLADRMETVEPDMIRTIREAARARLGAALGARFASLRARLAHTRPEDVSGPAAGRRAAANVALGYIAAAGNIAPAAAQFAAARTMTDRLAALSLLADTMGPERDDALARFHAEWRADALVLDKWFAVQARSGAADTPARVRALADHPDFDRRNPNRLRSLIGAFAANQAAFHHADGAGYRLLAETIAGVDPLNPEIAARLVSPLGAWRRYDAGRQEKMRAALAHILATPSLSRNTYEMASKAQG